jgi:hypothetical protein
MVRDRAAQEHIHDSQRLAVVSGASRRRRSDALIHIKGGEIMEIGDYVIVRSDSAGVFAGTLEKEDGKEVTLTDARRLWYWSGAATLSQLAMEGTKDPTKCKFPCAVSRVKIKESIELLDVTPEAKKSIEGVKIWAK